MILLLTDVFLLLTQLLLWIVVGLITYYIVLRALPKLFLGRLVLGLILIVLALGFYRGPLVDNGVLEVLWRIVSFPLSPLGLGIVLLLLLLSGAKLASWVRNLILIGLVLLALGSIPIVSYYLARELEQEGIEVIQAAATLPAGARRVIVVLGQETTRPQLRPAQEGAPENIPRAERQITLEAYQILSRLPTQITEQGDRLLYAGQLYQREAAAGTSPLLVVSAAPRLDRKRRDVERREDVSESADIRAFLSESYSIPASNILLDHDSYTIRSSAENVSKLLKANNVNYGNQLLLIASAMNMHRAYLTFDRFFKREVNIDTTIYARPTDFYTLPEAERLRRVARGRDLVERGLPASDFIPTADAFSISSRAINEYVASIYYFLRLWIDPFR